MKLIKLFYFLFILSAHVIHAQTAPSAVAGSNGIWILCGNQAAVDFQYRILRSSERNADESEVASLKCPSNSAELQARLMDLSSAGQKIRIPDKAVLDRIFLSLTANGNLDSLQIYKDNYVMLYALGLAWFDNGTVKNIKYSYTVEKVKGKTVMDRFPLASLSFPGKPCSAKLTPLNAQVLLNGIHVEYQLTSPGNMQSCRIYRSYYQRTGFEELHVQPIFFKKENNWVLSFDDASAASKVPYSYFVVPTDAAGNEGEPSPLVNLYNEAGKSVAPSVTDIHTYSNTGNHAIHLGWRVNATRELVSIDIYKSMLYDGRYFKVASVGPSDTSWVDNNVNPVQNFYYSLVLNGMYGTSDPSPRISGMLQASEENYLPIQGLELTQAGRIVTLSWKRTEPNTHGYYLHRGIGYTGELIQRGILIPADSNEVSIKDTLPENPYPQVYSYAITDVNTSYKVGPYSNPVYAYDPGLLAIPVVASVQAFADGENVRLLWENVAENSPFAGAYIVYRRATDAAGGEVEKKAVLDTLDIVKNSFVDKNVKEGFKYFYSIVVVSHDRTLASQSSPEAAFDLAHGDYPNATDVKIFAGMGEVSLSWNNPVAEGFSGIRIWRGELGKEPALLTELQATESQYQDKSVAKGKTYFYQIQCVYGKQTSAISNADGVFVR